MAISLSKGQKVDLTKNNPGLKKILLGLGWDTNKYSGGKDFDLDASAFLVSVGNKVNDSDFIFYNNLTHSSGAVTHTGDNRTGDGDGDDEQIKIDFSKIPSTIEKIAITVTIHDGILNGQNFGQVSNAYIRLLDEETNTELLRYDLGEDYSVETALIFAEIYKNGNDWKFNALGSGFEGGLPALCKNYGLDV
ncbi:MAG: TerD family protein [Fusobacteriaceae bacterium]